MLWPAAIIGLLIDALMYRHIGSPDYRDFLLVPKKKYIQ